VADQFFVKFSNVNFNENTSAVVELFNVYGRTDRLSELHLLSPGLRTRLKLQAALNAEDT
jgi:hypothetical protein